FSTPPRPASLVEEVPMALTDQLTLEPAPNPFREQTTLTIHLPEAGQTNLRVYDQRGTLVRTLANGVLDAGRQSFQWNGRDDSGRVLPTGLYVIRLDTPTASQTKLIMFLSQ
ncbi:MAG: T9SS type A sorting domain-containing protein, partial [Lewinella sp.]|nr:T9SS type A sorting domain-containing protein [Lewinella sp.]